VLFSQSDLRRLAKDLKFTKRIPRKIEVINLLASVCSQCLQGSPSCNDLAAQIQTLSGHAPSRQAVSLRLNQAPPARIWRMAPWSGLCGKITVGG
jgi:hypothetical protein